MAGKAEHAYLHIREKIITGELEPLADISEEMFMAELEMSRTPVREAILRLEADGFVMIYPRKGTFVSAISMDANRWVYDVRYLCEPWMCANACGKIPRDNLFSLKNTFSELLVKPNKERSIEMDDRLHQMIADTIENPFIRDMMSRVQAHDRRIRIKIGEKRVDYNTQDTEHLKIVEALLSGDPVQCKKAMEGHVQTARAVSNAYFS